MTTHYTLRPARPDDARGISEVIVSALRETNAKDYPQDIIEKMEKDHSPDAVLELMTKQRVFVIVAEERIVGTGSLDGKMVRTVFVSPDCHGQGIGKKLMREIERSARDFGVPKLEVFSSITAEGFYTRLGFTIVSEIDHAQGHAIIMERSLGPL